MDAGGQFEQTLRFDPQSAEAQLAAIPAQSGVFALYGPPLSASTESESSPAARPYLTRTADLRRRLRRLLSPPDPQSKRLNLRDRVGRIEYTVTGSEFESTLLLHRAYARIYGAAEGRRRLRLRTPFFIRFAAENAHPRAYVTNRITKRGQDCFYGPFASRTAAERYLDETLNLFKLRRCPDDLKPDPTFPGCVYSEMKMCLAPCFKGCTEERYAEEAAAVHRFLDTNGGSLIGQIAAERDQASSTMDFERAAALHTQMLKAKAAAALADPIIRPLPQLDALILQRSASGGEASADIALFLLRGGVLAGPLAFSTLGMRHANERSGSTSLFAQPLALAPVPLAEDGAPSPPSATSASLDDRLMAAIEALRAALPTGLGTDMLSDHLSLLRRWYYRPEKQRAGEIFFADRTAPDAASNAAPAFPLKKILRGVSRVVSGVREATAEEQAQATHNLHHPH